ncbi:hypothetical protein QAD02_015868 [Eretmocerus hayati]|uniref:Uncharacterized protein n=1 Tax=Eretmocerus hayati TaxID=131215 RepID=A0ACC2PB72_9HYME|nr:hypothetical protein QAD02_015868 [Eretmocerus hayati]
MLWSAALWLLLAGAAVASQHGGWEDGKQYLYKVKSRTMAAVNQQSNQYAGILIDADLKLQVHGGNTLRATISHAKYAQIHTRLDKGWEAEIPESQMQTRDLPLSNKPIEIKVKNGVVKDLVVNKHIPTWELNVIKSIISGLQVDAQGENKLKSEGKEKSTDKTSYESHKVMEDSISGKCEVIYNISPVTSRLIQSKPELVPLPELLNEGGLLLVSKIKNYSNCDQRISYNFGINRENNWEPGNNYNGKYLLRSTSGRIVISGDVKRYTIQSSLTTNKIIHSGDDSMENQQGVVFSSMNLTISEVKDISDQIPSVTDARATGNLVYNYDNPFDMTTSWRPRSTDDHRNNKNQRRNDETDSDESTDNTGSSSESSEARTDNHEYLQQKPKIEQPAHNPFLPLYIGNRGKSIKIDNKVDAVKHARSLAQQIGQELERADTIPDEKTLEKFTILIRLIRILDREQIAEVRRELYEQHPTANQLKQSDVNRRVRRNTWIAVRDALAEAGTGPALLNIKYLIENKQIKDGEAVNVINTVAKSARTPTPEYMRTLYDMAMDIPKDEEAVREAAIFAFSDLARQVIVDRRAARKRYPLNIFGRLFSKNNKDLHTIYLPKLMSELESAIEEANTRKVQLYSTAIGKIAHPRMLAIYEPYLEGKKPISLHQRLVMVLSLDKLAEVFPKIARSVLFKIYINNEDSYEIRTAAVYLLMKAKPSPSMVHRIAEHTNFDSNKQVNSAVKSIIDSLSRLQDDENQELAESARSAQALLTPENYGPQYSMGEVLTWKNPLTEAGFSLEAYTIGSDDSIIPKGFYLSNTPSSMGMKGSKMEALLLLSSSKAFIDLIFQKLEGDQNSQSQDGSQQTYSPENLAKMLGVSEKESKKLEGLLFTSNGFGNHYTSFDKKTLESIPKQFEQVIENMKKGEGYEETKLNNIEVTVSFPTDTGFPFYFTYNNPTVMSLNGATKLNVEPESESQMPKSIKAFGKVRIVYGMEVQKRIGFVTPFESQEYIAGIDKSVQIHLPIHTELDINLEKNEARLSVKPNADKEEYRVLQYELEPFTAKHDIFNLEPITRDEDTHVLMKNKVQHSQVDINDKKDKLRLQFKWESKHRLQNTIEAVNDLSQSILSTYYPISMKTEYKRYSVHFSPSSDMAIQVALSYGSEKTTNDEKNEDSENKSPNAKAPYLERSLDEEGRKQKMLREAGKDITSGTAIAIDAKLQVTGDLQSSLTLTAAVAGSHVDKKSRALLYASARLLDQQDLYISAGIETKIPHVESLSYEETLEANGKSEFDIEFHYGQGDGSDIPNRHGLKVQGSLMQTDERKNEIRQSREAQDCNEHSRDGNRMTEACEKVNKRAASVDAGDFVVTFENEPYLKLAILDALDSAERMSHNLINSHKNRKDREDDNKMRFDFKLSSDNKKMDVGVKTSEGKLHLKDIKLTRKGYDTFRNGEESLLEDERDSELDGICSIDKTEINTFDNHRYPIHLGKCWHVVMTPYPIKNADEPESKKSLPGDMRVSVLTRDNENGQKELKITIGNKVIDLTPSGSSEPEVKVNGKNVRYSKTKSHIEENSNREIVFELFEVGKKSVKLVSDKYDVEVTYDGFRARVTVGDQYRNSIKGLCGNNDGEPENDQQTPKGCMLQKPDEFAATYALVNDDQCSGPARKLAEDAKSSECTYTRIQPGNVVSDEEAGRKNKNDSKEEAQKAENEQRCTIHRTKTIFTDHEICFSLRPLPACSSKCKPKDMKRKAIQFHCVPRNSASEKVAQRIEDGANPDLTQKDLSKTVDMSIPLGCKP